jgi:hypothetical protein
MRLSVVLVAVTLGLVLCQPQARTQNQQPQVQTMQTTNSQPIPQQQNRMMMAPIQQNSNQQQRMQTSQQTSFPQNRMQTAPIQQNYNRPQQTPYPQPVPQQLKKPPVTPAKDVGRLGVIHEIIDSEKAHLEDLLFLDNMYAQPLLTLALQPELGVISLFDYNQIFSGFESVLHVQVSLLPKLHRTSPSLVEAFLHHAYYFNAQKLFFRNSKRMNSRVEALRGSNKKFNRFVSDHEKQDRSKKEFLSYMNAPIQRIAQYVGLLEKLKKNTPQNHPESAMLDTTIVAYKKVQRRLKLEYYRGSR